MARPETLIRLDAATDPARARHKAASLAELSRLGLPVPDGFVITVGASRPSE